MKKIIIGSTLIIVIAIAAIVYQSNNQPKSFGGETIVSVNSGGTSSTTLTGILKGDGINSIQKLIL